MQEQYNGLRLELDDLVSADPIGSAMERHRRMWPGVFFRFKSMEGFLVAGYGWTLTPPVLPRETC